MGSPLVVSSQAKREFFCSTTGVSPELKKKGYGLREFDATTPSEDVSPESSLKMGEGLGGRKKHHRAQEDAVKILSDKEHNNSSSIGFKLKINKMVMLDQDSSL